MREFKRGEFIKKKHSDYLIFAIYDGLDVKSSYAVYPQYSLLLFYHSHHWDFKDGQWDYYPYLELANQTAKMETCDSAGEDYWWGVCTPEEKEEALQIIRDNGYEWDEEKKRIVRLDTKEEVCRCANENVVYDGAIITPSEAARHQILIGALKRGSRSYGMYEDYYTTYW